MNRQKCAARNSVFVFVVSRGKSMSEGYKSAVFPSRLGAEPAYMQCSICTGLQKKRK